MMATKSPAVSPANGIITSTTQDQYDLQQDQESFNGIDLDFSKVQNPPSEPQSNDLTTLNQEPEASGVSTLVETAVEEKSKGPDSQHGRLRIDTSIQFALEALSALTQSPQSALLSGDRYSSTFDNSESNGKPSSSTTTSTVAAQEAASRRKRSSTPPEVRAFPCPDCDKSFTQLAHLNIHQRKHTGERPYTCTFEGCSKSFTQFGNLKTHERKHTGERPFKCSHCGKAFSQMGNMKTHEQLHLGIRPFVCNVPGCTKSFTQLGNLRSHQAKVHVDEVGSIEYFVEEKRRKRRKPSSIVTVKSDSDVDEEYISAPAASRRPSLDRSVKAQSIDDAPEAQILMDLKDLISRRG